MGVILNYKLFLFIRKEKKLLKFRIIEFKKIPAPFTNEIVGAFRKWQPRSVTAGKQTTITKVHNVIIP